MFYRVFLKSEVSKSSLLLFTVLPSALKGLLGFTEFLPVFLFNFIVYYWYFPRFQGFTELFLEIRSLQEFFTELPLFFTFFYQLLDLFPLRIETRQLSISKIVFSLRY